jgi:hypothetical protein
MLKSKIPLNAVAKVKALLNLGKEMAGRMWY